MTEEENTCKISVPLINDNEIRQIDNYLDDIVHQFTKQLVHDKDLAIAQHIIQKQQEEIEKLKKILLEVCYEGAKQYFEEEPEV